MASETTVVRRFHPEDTSKPIIWTSKECPFAERAAIAFHEMGIQFDSVEVDLRNKPASLFEVNSKGLVPAMKDQGNCITDSYNIVQYIDDMWLRSDNKGISPKTPSDRAFARIWCEYINNNVVKFFYQILLKQNVEEQEAAKASMLESLRVLNNAMKSIDDGPFFMGSDFTLVDIMLAPHVERFPALKLYRGFQVPETEEYARFKSWWNAVEKWPSFQPARVSESFMAETYKKYADNTADSKVAQAMRKGEVIP